jgi:hypothetical protein
LFKKKNSKQQGTAHKSKNTARACVRRKVPSNRGQLTNPSNGELFTKINQRRRINYLLPN